MTSRVEVDGVSLYYRVVGDPSSPATPLMLLHGGLMHGDSMEPLAGRLATERAVVVLDQRAHGRSGDSDEPLTYERMGDDAARVAEALGFERVDVLGYSMGAGVALQMAIRHPERVGKLVVLSGTYRRDGWYPEVLESIGNMTAADAVGTHMEIDYRRLSPTPDAFPRWFERVNKLNYDEQDIPDEDVRGISAPTMVIVGDADSVRLEHAVELFVLRGGGDRTAAAMGITKDVPRARLLVLPAASHLGLMAWFDDIARHVGDFLRDAPPRVPAGF